MSDRHDAETGFTEREAAEMMRHGYLLVEVGASIYGRLVRGRPITAPSSPPEPVR